MHIDYTVRLQERFPSHGRISTPLLSSIQLNFCCSFSVGFLTSSLPPRRALGNLVLQSLQNMVTTLHDLHFSQKHGPIPDHLPSHTQTQSLSVHHAQTACRACTHAEISLAIHTPDPAHPGHQTHPFIQSSNHPIHTPDPAHPGHQTHPQTSAAALPPSS